MSSTGYVVWLRAPASVLQDRIERDPASARTRPALSGESAVAEVAEVLERRYSLYEAAADCVVDTGDFDEAQVCGAVLEAITELLK
jgi:shikimate kinase